ncbi:MAG TPA: orotate phosphoribosyltransferase [Bacillota bacterium]|jgi:orotate phosphoribosyltransferase|nr:orotate phosphoribosyltransferase [Bacillota bacterium]NLU55055.1 orotate phosphoribosyltransferase [Bacillota bacterium]HOJ47134.1 orotate phosphoribosyltransferase [Bacillota bacterium]HOL13747.1 orotate phosphoribosyltransferase [Bacillota bacterium]HOP53467.1 orotate phosphoribosyltransferase [Bacillota bacterium]
MTEIKAIFQESGALLSGHFKLTSGKHSGQYVQCARVLENPEITQKLVAKWVERLQGVPVDVVIGPAVGGIILSYELGRQLGKKAIFAEREGGKLTLRRTFAIEPGERVVVVEDVVTTGGSVLETMEVVKQAGGTVEAVCALVDRGSGFDPGTLYVPLLTIDIASYLPEECPYCREGLPLTAPGSRSLK